MEEQENFTGQAGSSRNAACPGEIWHALLMRLEQPEDRIYRIRFFKAGPGPGNLDCVQKRGGHKFIWQEYFNPLPPKVSFIIKYHSRQ